MKLRIDGKLYPTGTRPSTMGDLLVLKREFDWTPEGADGTATACMLAFTALREALPQAPAHILVEQVKLVRELEYVNDDGTPLSETQAKEERDPTPPSSDDESGSDAAREKASD